MWIHDIFGKDPDPGDSYRTTGLLIRIRIRIRLRIRLFTSVTRIQIRTIIDGSWWTKNIRIRIHNAGSTCSTELQGHTVMPTHGSWSRLINWRTPWNWCLRLIVVAVPTFAFGAVLLSQKIGCKHVFSEMKTWNQWIGYTGRRLVESGPWSRPVKESQSPTEKLHFMILKRITVPLTKSHPLL